MNKKDFIDNAGIELVNALGYNLQQNESEKEESINPFYNSLRNKLTELGVDDFYTPNKVIKNSQQLAFISFLSDQTKEFRDTLSHSLGLYRKSKSFIDEEVLSQLLFCVDKFEEEDQKEEMDCIDYKFSNRYQFGTETQKNK
jgi:hypothetical protein